MNISYETEALWSLYSRKLKNEKSKKGYWNDISEFISFSNKDFLEINQADVDYYYQYHLKERPIKLTTLQKKVRELSAFSDFAVEQLPFISNERDDFKNYFCEKLIDLNERVRMSKGHIPSIKEMDILLQASQDNFMHFAIFALIFRCAVRPMELIQIKISDLLIKEGKWYLAIGKTKEKRIIPLPEDIVSILQKYNQIREPYCEFYFSKGMKKLNERYLERLVQEYARKAGIPPITLYGIRDASIAMMTAYAAPDFLIGRDCGITANTVDRYKGIQTYPLEQSAIHFVKIRII